MILEKRFDGLTLIVERKKETHIKLPEGKGTLNVKCALGYEISQLLKVARKSEWKDNDFSLEDGSIYFGNEEERLGLQVKASFFLLRENPHQDLNNILALLQAKGLKYKFTRIDICYVLDTPIFRELTKSNFKNIDTNERKRNKDLYWFSSFSTIFGVVCYDKQRQLKKIKKKQPKYFETYKAKYGDKPIYHFELRFFQFEQKNHKTKIITRRIPSVWEEILDFQKVEEEIRHEILGRVKFHRAILHLLKTKGGQPK